MSENIRLRRALAYLNEGKRDACLKLVLPILKQNPSNEEALWLFARATDDAKRQQDALKRLLAINPQHVGAKAMFAKLSGDHPSTDRQGRNARSKKASSGSNTRKNAWLRIAVLVGTILLVVAFVFPFLQKPYLGVLLVGDSANESGYIEIDILSPREFDGLSREEIYDLRTRAVNRYPTLIRDNYQPNRRVFGQIEDGKPWWGIVGQWVYGTGDRSTIGASEESRFIMNPYILVAPEFYGMSPYGEGERENVVFWEPDANVESSSFPHTCLIDHLYWFAEDRRVVSYYDVSDCMFRISAYTVTRLSLPTNGQIDLIAYNARDFGLNYIYVDYEASENVSKFDAPTQAVRIPHYIHTGDSCGFEGGCNNMSPAFEPLEQLWIHAVPATMVVKLWQSNPPNVNNEADMTHTIEFR